MDNNGSALTSTGKLKFEKNFIKKIKITESLRTENPITTIIRVHNISGKRVR